MLLNTYKKQIGTYLEKMNNEIGVSKIIIIIKR